MITEELESLKRTVENLNAGGFKYMLTGSMAMGFYSVPRMTRDSDIIIELNSNDVYKFFNLFKVDFYADLEMIQDSLEKEMMFNLFDKKTLFKIDFILKREDDYENLKFERMIKKKINGIELNVISIEDLIISKLNWAKDTHSQAQLNDVRLLMKNQLDKSYLKSMISNLKLTEIYNKI